MRTEARYLFWRLVWRLCWGLPLVFPAVAQQDALDKTAFEKVCGTCHKSSIISDLKTESEWIETVDNMVANGAKGTEEQFDGVMRYLTRNLSRVNVNAATAREIAPVLDVPKETAQLIVAYRSQRGNFTSLDDLMKVPGLNAAKLLSRKERIVFK